MAEPQDWLEQTWEIKRNIAHRYAGMPMSQQLQDMRERLRQEFAERGWSYPKPFDPDSFKMTDVEKQ